MSYLSGMRILLVLPLLALVACGSPEATLPTVQVFKTPTCGCCNDWVDHLRDAGFTVETTDLRDLRDVKHTAGVPHELASCHTARVDGYIVEGHVPAEDVQRLLVDRPAVTGIAVPGMPIGSPGMEGPNPESYHVIAFGGLGEPSIFATHHP